MDEIITELAKAIEESYKYRIDPTTMAVSQDLLERIALLPEYAYQAMEFAWNLDMTNYLDNGYMLA